jgi:hypothetical protein
MPQPDYGTKEYWDARYLQAAEDEEFEWYGSYETFAKVVEPHVAGAKFIVDVGCGNAPFSLSLPKAPTTLHFDVSPVLIESLVARHADRTFVVGDCTQFASVIGEDRMGTVDLVLDKGTLDALVCGPAAATRVNDYLTGVGRAMRAAPTSAFIVMTYGREDSRLCYLDQPHLPWTVKVHHVPKPGKAEHDVHYVYECLYRVE